MLRSLSTRAGDSSDDISAGSQPLQVSQGSEASEEGSQGTQRSQSTQGSQSTQPLSQFRGCKMSDRVRAVAFLTLGENQHARELINTQKTSHKHDNKDLCHLHSHLACM